MVKSPVMFSTLFNGAEYAAFMRAYLKFCVRQNVGHWIRLGLAFASAMALGWIAGVQLAPIIGPGFAFAFLLAISVLAARNGFAEQLRRGGKQVIAASHGKQFGYEVTEDGLKISKPTGITISYPWSVLHIIYDHPIAWLVKAEDSAVYLPKSAFEQAGVTQDVIAALKK